MAAACLLRNGTKSNISDAWLLFIQIEVVVDDFIRNVLILFGIFLQHRWSAKSWKFWTLVLASHVNLTYLRLTCISFLARRQIVVRVINVAALARWKPKINWLIKQRASGWRQSVWLLQVRGIVDLLRSFWDSCISTKEKSLHKTGSSFSHCDLLAHRKLWQVFSN